jgi:hypothetical protein
LPLPCLNLSSLAFPCFALPCLALLSLPCIPSLALPSLALPCLALPLLYLLTLSCLGLSLVFSCFSTLALSFENLMPTCWICKHLGQHCLNSNDNMYGKRSPLE